MLEELLSLTNNKYTLRPERFYEVKRKYMGLYQAQLLKMWDLGYTMEVSVFKEEDFLASYSDEGINLKFRNGKVKLEPWVFYTEWLLSGRKSEFYYDMDQLLEYREACITIDLIYDNSKMYKAKSTKPFQWGISYSYSGMRGTSRATQLGRVGYELLISEDKYIREVEISSLVSLVIAKELGFSMEAITVLDGISLYDLGSYAEDLLTGGVVLDNDFLTRLLGVGGSVVESISNLLHKHKDVVEEHLSEYDLSRYGDFMGVSNTHLYFSADKDTGYREKLPFGAFSVDYDSGKVLSSLNNYYGITGDFVTLSSSLFSEDGLNFVGCPIYLFDENGEKSLYVSVEQVEGLGESSLIYDLGLELSFRPSGTYSLREEMSLVDYYVNSHELAEEGLFFRFLTGYYSSDERDLAIKKANSLLGG